MANEAAFAAPIRAGRVLFAHDHRFIPAEGAVWSEQQFEAALWTRYLAHFEAVTVVGRRGAMPEGRGTAMLERSSAPDVDFALLPNLSSLRGMLRARGPARERMRALVADCDAVIARLPSEIGLLAVAEARAACKPWAVEVVGCPYDGMSNYGSLAGRLYAPLAMRRMQRAVAASDHAIYVTRNFLQDRYPSSAVNTTGVSDVILESVDEEVLVRRLIREQRHAQAEERASAAPLRLGLIGTLRGRFKGIQSLIEALAACGDALPEWQLHILGGGDPVPWQEAARAAGLGERVRFDGTLPAGEAVFRWLDEIDIYLQPSLKEGLPRALVEAMSRGCPAIASSVAGIPELLPQEDLMAPGDAAALAELLQRRLDNAAWRRDRARRNWEVACCFRSDLLAERRDRFWRRFAAAARASAPREAAE
ncbi:glycosyltransferase family 4 protein [Sagittula sp. M10.9X]|uniref:Glycosyltransferase family 4 protein n=2 Tax=Sagittula salina TaxID=2820268 RepID=A0A940S2V2_9RHOB|nr:glycosyltransferase family 4 protein [Sagittula salina]